MELADIGGADGTFFTGSYLGNITMNDDCRDLQINGCRYAPQIPEKVWNIRGANHKISGNIAPQIILNKGCQAVNLMGVTSNNPEIIDNSGFGHLNSVNFICVEKTPIISQGKDILSIIRHKTSRGYLSRNGSLYDYVVDVKFDEGSLIDFFSPLYLDLPQRPLQGEWHYGGIFLHININGKSEVRHTKVTCGEKSRKKTSDGSLVWLATVECLSNKSCVDNSYLSSSKVYIIQLSGQLRYLAG